MFPPEVERTEITLKEVYLYKDINGVLRKCVYYSKEGILVLRESSP
jgi:hypothetical protein